MGFISCVSSKEEWISMFLWGLLSNYKFSYES